MEHELGVKPMSAECLQHLKPVRDSLDILNGKWKIPIIVALLHHNYRFKELHRLIDGVTPKMLSKELKELELNELVKRTVFDTTPVTVEYSITPYGKSLEKVIFELGKWGSEHRARIMKGKESIKHARCPEKETVLPS